MDRIVLHFDMDCFYCQVETRRLGLPKDTPLIVHSWGMAMSVNYAAKAIGITRKTHAREAVAMGAVAVHMRTIDIDTGEIFDEFDYENTDRNRYKSSVERYREASEQVMTAMKGALPASSRFERASIDECFVDVDSEDLLELFSDNIDPSILNWEGGSYTDSLQDMVLARGGFLGERIRSEVLQVTDYTASCGVSVTRQVAKLVCALNKPDKLTVVSSSRTTEFMRQVPIKEIRGLGPRAFETLKARVPYVDWKTTVCQDLWSEENIGTDEFGTWFYGALRGLDKGNHVDDSATLLANSVQSSKQFRPPLGFAHVVDLLRSLTADMLVRLGGRGAKTLIVVLQTPTATASRQCDFPKEAMDDTVLGLAKKTGLLDSKNTYIRLAVGAKDVESITAASTSVNEYLSASRLHFMGTWKARYAEYMSHVEETGDWGEGTLLGNFVFPSTSENSFYIFVDMDCFFVSVAIHMAGAAPSLPAAVASGLGATSELSSANYAARKFGLKANTYLKKAKELCPELKIYPVTTELLLCCETVWKKVLCILALAVGNDLTRVSGKSCDEAFISNADPILASEIQKIVKLETGIPCSVGIGPTKILAKLATSFAKPAGIKQIHSPAQLASEPVSILPGAGYVACKKLEEFGITLVHQLLDRRNEVARILGSGIAKKLIQTAEGIDFEETEEKNHTVSAEKNFGLRNLTIASATDLIRALADEVLRRIPKDARVDRATLKIKIAVPGWTESFKKGGMGEVFDWSKGCRWTSRSTDLADVLSPLLNDMDAAPDRIRGIGVAVRLTRSVAEGPLDNLFGSKKIRSSPPKNFAANTFLPVDAGVMDFCSVCNAQVVVGCLTKHFLTHLEKDQHCVCPICHAQIAITDNTHIANHFA